MTSHISGRRALVTGRILLAVLLLTALGARTATAQGSYDKGTPPELKAGQSSASTYSADKVETVNLSNGNLSMVLPLATLGGRGSASYAVALSYNSKVWSSINYPVTTQDPSNGSVTTVDHISAVHDHASMSAPNVVALGGGWTIQLGAAVKMQRVLSDPVTGVNCNHREDTGGGVDVPTCGYFHVLTKASLYLPDGSEVVLRDVLTNGAPARTTDIESDGYHRPTDRDRGRVWQSTDGSNVTYVTDAENGMVTGQFAGWVFLADGTRLRMDEFGRCSRIEDRNGNFVTFSLDALFVGPATITDQLGRQVTVVRHEAGATVTVKGYGVADRVYHIDTGVLAAPDGAGVRDNLREDYRNWQRPFLSGDFRNDTENDIEHLYNLPHTDLFPRSEGGESIDEKEVVTGLRLPDGRALRFRYNPWGEVAEVTYPGGGVSKIDYEGTGSEMCAAGDFNQLGSVLNRQVRKRRLLADGANTDVVWTYEYSYLNTQVEARRGAADGPLLSSERHFFKDLNGVYSTCFQSWGTGDEKWQNAKEYRVERQTGTGTQVTTREWEQRATPTWGNDVGLSYNWYKSTHGMEVDLPNYPRVTREETTFENGRVKRVDYGHDQFNNVTSVKEYDFQGAGGSWTLLREVRRVYVGNAAAGGPSYNGYCYTGVNPLDTSCGAVVLPGQPLDANKIIHQRHLLLSEEVLDGNEQREAYVEYEYDHYRTGTWADGAPDANPGMIGHDAGRFAAFPPDRQPRGNVTAVKTWVSGSGANAVYTESFTRYDAAGNVVASKDPGGNVSAISYADDFGDGTSPGGTVAGTNGPTFAFPTAATNALGHQAKTQYDYTRGVATGTKDPNGVISRIEYDAIGRPVRTTSALGVAGQQVVVEMSYPTAALNVAKVSQQFDSTRWLASKTEFDGFDRPVLAAAAEDGRKATDNNVAFTIFTKTVYDPLGRVRLVTSPYGAQAAPTDGWTRMTYDLAGRVTEVATFAGGVSSPPPDEGTNAAWTGSVVTTYDGERTTIRDQANKQRRSTADGLGRLKSVDEMLEYPSNSVYATTTYDYDARGNLTAVQQPPQARAFAYDGLSRLILARNPEQGATLSDGRAAGLWSMRYVYDPAGTLKEKTDARGVVSKYEYDALNRNTRVRYENDPSNTPGVDHAYDGAIKGVGRGWRQTTLDTSVTPNLSLVRNSVEEYDAAGRPLRAGQSFATGNVWGPSYGVTLEYDLAGNVLSQTYPSERKVTYQYDAAGRLNSFTGDLGDSVLRTYSSELSYDGAGRMRQERYGTTTPVYNKHFYNNRGQLAEIRVGTQPITGSDPGFWNRGAIINHYSSSGWGATGGGADNNGNLRKQDVYTPNDDQISGHSLTTFFYEYDALNRLESVKEGRNGVNQWRQQYDYDRWGNRTINEGGTWLAQPSATPSSLVNETQFDKTDASSTNRLYAPGDLSYPDPNDPRRKMRYDAAGNLVHDSHTGGGDRTFDAEGRMTSAQLVPGQPQASRHAYDAGGRRVKRKVGTPEEVWQVYGLGGELLAEYAPNAAPARPQKEYGYRAGVLLVTAEAPARFNVALSANGGAATASSTFSQPNWVYSPGGAIDGNRRGSSLGAGHWSTWHDTTQGVFDDTLEVTFSGPKTIDEINVFSQQDNYANPSEPTEALTFSTYGLSGFQLQYWDGAGWVNVQGGSVSGSNKVWRKVTFPAVTTSRIRVVTKASVDGYSRIAEVEAWGTSAPVAPADAVTGFSATQNPAGAWSYGYRSGGGAFTPYAAHNQQFGAGLDSWSTGTCCPSVTRNATGATKNYAGVVSHPSDLLHLHPGPGGEKSVVRWTAPAAGTYTVSGRFEGINTVGTTTDVAVTKNGVPTFSGSVNGHGTQVPFSLPVTVAAGDTLEFLVGYGSNGTYSNDSTGLAATITAAGAGGASGADVRWLVSDHLGTPRMVLDRTGSLAGVSRHDYLPFGEEIGAGTGGRTTNQGYFQYDGMRMKFTGAERDDETDLDFMQARYYSFRMGRFTSPDDFLNDSDPYDPQSWNKYAYVRNNPLKYIDPTGKKADVKIETDEKKKTGTITITASIAIFSKGTNNYSMEELDEVKGKIEDAIHSAWNGQFEKDGITYTVTTCVTVTTHESEDAAGASGADNVIGINHQWANPGKGIISNVDERFFSNTRGPDTGTWNYGRVMNGQQAAHEFTHILGAPNDPTGNRANVSFAPTIGDWTPVSVYKNATQHDYRHALRDVITGHRQANAQSSSWVVANSRKIARKR